MSERGGEGPDRSEVGARGDILVAEKIVKSFPVGRERLTVLRGAGLRVEKGEMLAIVGASGAGKTTLLHILGGLDRPDEGAVRFDGVDITQLGDSQRAKFRNSAIGFVFQFYHLLADFDLLENTLFPAKIGRKLSPHNKNLILNRAAELLGLVGLSERLHHKPGQLSGGEQQRAAIARALLNEPKVVLADEPTGNLDAQTGETVFRLLREINERGGRTIVIATHDQKLAQLCDRVVRMVDGVIAE